MKFSYKLTAVLVAVLALVLSLSGMVTAGVRFGNEFAAAQAALESDWQRESYNMQCALVTQADADFSWRVSSYLRTLNAQSGVQSAAYTAADGQELYICLPNTAAPREIDTLLGGAGEPRVALTGKHILLCAGTVVLPEQCVTLVLARDVRDVWQARTDRLLDALRTEALVLAFAAALVLVLCRRLTRPLEQLEAASRQIAAGAYEMRTGLDGDDEIGSLSRSFDHMAASVEETVSALNDSVRQRDDFVAAFTHELKTPMTSMLGYADLLRGSELPADTRRLAADYIYHESKRLEDLSAKLMELMGLNGEPPALAPTDLGTVLRALERALPPGDPVPSLPHTGAVVLAQRDLLCDLLFNLVQNARKATPPDGTVAVELTESETDVAVTVRDTGCGIPAGDLPRVTEPFYMADKSRARQQGGSGMGLALCARIAALHGTELHFESAVGRGTAVRFTLQKADDSKDDTEKEDADHERTLPAQE